MIRELLVEDLDEANFLLAKFNYQISIKTLGSHFFKSLVYKDTKIRGIIVYDLLYDRIEIEYIFINDDYRKKGIGSKFLKEIEKHNVKNITLEVRESNICAIEFYKKNGYRIVTLRKNYYENENGYLMIKELGE